MHDCCRPWLARLGRRSFSRRRTENKTLKTTPDGSLTFYVQAEPPPEAQRDNWLPAPKGADFSLFMRAY
jgi:hypothetical protein